ncbi:MAG: GAF domain-containing protein, partial [Bacteroidia bacterium]
MNINSVINFLAESLEKATTIDELCWDLAKNCISKLNFEDCVVYLLDNNKQKLVQKAAFGPKNPKGKIIVNPIEIPLGKGIVGSVALHGITELINDTSKDSRYIVDDKRRYSELTVPIKFEGKIIGVIDSEHSDKNFFTPYHLNILTVISSFLGNRIKEIATSHENNITLNERISSIISKEVDYLILHTQTKTYKIHKND